MKINKNIYLDLIIIKNENNINIYLFYIIIKNENNKNIYLYNKIKKLINIFIYNK